MTLTETDREEAIRLAWSSGRLAYKYRPIQKRFSQAWTSAQRLSKKFVLNSGRRTTKSSWLLLTDFETCIQEPGSYLAFVAPVEKALAQYIQQIGDELLRDCPNDLRPVFKKQECQYYFPHSDSTISFAGSNQQSYNNLRGKKFKRSSVDEAAFVDNLKELVEGVLIPAISDSNGYLRLSSTPPDVPDHAYQHYFEQAMLGGYGAHFTILDAGYSPEWIETWAKEVGGKESSTFRREYLGQFVIDAQRLIIPEWEDRYVESATRTDLFQFWDKYFSLDIGSVDKTVGHLFFYDFQHAVVHFEDEIVYEGRNWTTEDLAIDIRAKEFAQWGPANQVYRRVGDSNNQILLADLTHLHKLTISATSKDSLQAMVNEARMWVKSGRVRVHPRCKLLIQTLKTGVWNKTKDEFSRTPTLGHMDALASFIYGIRNIDQLHNPVPVTHGFDPASQYWDPALQNRKEGHQLQTVFVRDNPFAEIGMGA